MRYFLMLLLIVQGCSSDENSSNTSIKLYTFDCGKITFADLDRFSSAGDYAGTSATFSDGCFLIRHKDGDLLWDLGLDASLVENGPSQNENMTLSMNKTLVQQLSEIGMTPEDIEYISISHSHFDHGGQAYSFDKQTWLVHEKELEAIQVDGKLIKHYDGFESFNRKIFTGDYDVFGDGSVMILETPGHTPGHTVLQVMLEKTGPILLSGDLYHQAKSRELKRVPVFNSDEDQTRKSMERFEKIAAELNAKVIIQHEQKDINKLPKLPDYLE